jgi:hypothetical protein
MRRCQKKRDNNIITSEIDPLIRNFRFFEMINKLSASNIPGNSQYSKNS